MRKQRLLHLLHDRKQRAAGRCVGSGFGRVELKEAILRLGTKRLDLNVGDNFMAPLAND
jgi:hypothetical protein